MKAAAAAAAAVEVAVEVAVEAGMRAQQNLVVAATNPETRNLYGHESAESRQQLQGGSKGLLVYCQGALNNW